MLSKKDKLKIENICYANILSSYSTFHNHKNRGTTFSWHWWVRNCEQSTYDWLAARFGYVDPDARRYAKKFTYEVATSILSKTVGTV